MLYFYNTVDVAPYFSIGCNFLFLSDDRRGYRGDTVECSNTPSMGKSVHKILCDTCVWLDLAKKPESRSLLNVLFELYGDGKIEFIVPQIILDEFRRNKESAIKEALHHFSNSIKQTQSYMDMFGETAAKQAVLQQLSLIGHKVPRLDGPASNAADNIEHLLIESKPLKANDAIKMRAFERGIGKKAPFRGKTNCLADAVIFETFVEVVNARPSVKEGVVFVTHNIADFSEPQGHHKKPHPDIASVFRKKNVRYFTTLAEALEWISPGAIEEHAFDIENQPRTTEEIGDAIDLLWNQVWYNRHKYLRQLVEAKEETVDPEIWRGALAAAKRVEKRYGKKNLGPWDDFEWGMINGKLSALRWVLGDEWDFLDT